MSRTVADIMIRKVITIFEEDNLTELAQGMDHFHIRHLPVVSGKRLVGLITHRDLLRFSVSTLSKSTVNQAMDARTKEYSFAASVMTRDVTTIRPEASLKEAISVMLKSKFGCLPVVNENDELVGIISEEDLLKELAANI